MAKGRFLSKSVSTSHKLASLKSDSPRLLWTWLLPHLDREGRFHGDSAIVKGHAVPRLRNHTEKTIEADLKELAKVGLIILYEVNGDRYLQFTQFDKNQPGMRKDREAESQCPSPPDVVRSKSRVSPDLVCDDSKQALILKLKLKDKLKLKLNDEIVGQAISYLNEKADSKFSLKSDANRGPIAARIEEGRVLDDFKTVIDKKVAQWKGKTWPDTRLGREGKTVHGDDYLRPSTLFGAKNFENYLNEKETPQEKPHRPIRANGTREGEE